MSRLNQNTPAMGDSRISQRLEAAGDIISLIRQYALSCPDKDAVIFVRDPGKDDGHESLSYAQLDARARGIAAWLQKRFSPGSRILLLYPTSLDFAAAFIGCIYAGMIAVPAPLPGQHHHQRHRVKSIADDADIAAIFTNSGNLSAMKEWAVAEGLDGSLCFSTEENGFADADFWVEPSVDGETVMLLQYTSGSTGNPKGVMISHYNILHNVASISRVLGVTEKTRFGGWIPLYHDMGLIAQLLPGVLFGSTSILMAPTTFLKRPYLWLQMIDKYDIHHSCAPNFAYELAYRRITDEQRDKLDLSRWKYAVSGSEPIQAATLRNFARRFAEAGLREDSINPCYGMAEVTVFISGFSNRIPNVQHVDNGLLNRNEFQPVAETLAGQSVVSCGVALDFEACIVNPDTHEVLADGRVGEIWLRGKSIAKGYWRNESATAATFLARTSGGNGPFLRTGDFGVKYEGELYVTGRMKEMIIANGRNHYPQDIEHEIRYQHEELRGRVGAVFSVAVPNESEAIVVAHEINSQQDSETLRKLTMDIKLTIQKEFGLRISAVVLLKPGGVLRTTSGKIQRTAMRQSFLQGKLNPVYLDIDPGLNAMLTNLQAEESGESHSGNQPVEERHAYVEG